MFNNKKLKLGVDIGGSKINMVVLDRENKIVEKWYSDKPSLIALKEGVEQLVSKFKIAEVGLALPGVVSLKGEVINCPNLPEFNQVDFAKLFSGRIKKIKVANDVNCFLLAEMLLGKGKGYKYALGITFGTGIGGAICFDGKSIYQGAKGGAGEFGKMIINDEKTWEILYQATRNNKEEQAKINAQGVANLINIFEPEIIIIGGAGGKDISRNILEKNIFSPMTQAIKIGQALLNEDAVAVGSAIWQNKNK